jgi:AraC-like DNA-binding protein
MYAHMPIIRDILFGASKHGANLAMLCSKLGISSTDLNDSEKRLDFEKAYQVWEESVLATGDKLLGLHLGESTTPSIMGLIGHLMQSSPNLKVAFERLCEYGKLATDMFTYSWEKQAEHVVLKFQPAVVWMSVSKDSARQAVEQAMAGTLNVFSLLTGQKIYPVQVQFEFSKPKNLSEYDRIFQSAIQFSADSNQLIILNADMNRPVIGYDVSLFALFDALIQERVNTLTDKKSFQDLVKNLLLTEFKVQIPSVEIIASRLNMTPRTFQRKLLEEGTTYRKLSGSVRKELALQLIKKSNHKMEEIAQMLGYSDASSFRRAFKQWTDNNPSDY